MGLTPVYDYIVVEKHEEMANGIIVPPGANPIGARLATVIAVGPGRHSEYSAEQLPPPPCKVGDTLLIHGGAGTEVKHEGRTLWFILPRDIMAVKGVAA